ncbi:MAG: GAF domain-containing protein [Deltaproteobacteria bacterium]|nr:GAF domain-containing protein [Deltaproteobacteria bacterium]
MNTPTLSALVSSLLIGAIGLSVYLEARKRPPFIYFALFCLNLSTLYLFDFLHLYFDQRLALMASLAADAIVPISALKFFKVFLNTDAATKPRVESSLKITSNLFLAVIAYLTAMPNARIEQVFVPTLFAYVVLGLLLCVILIYRRLQKANNAVERTRLKYLIYGGGLAVVVVFLGQLPSLGATAGAIGKLLGVIYLYFLAQMLSYYRLLDLQEMLARLSILTSLVFMIAGVYLALTFWVDPAEPGLLFYNTLMASLIVIILLDPVRAAVQERIHRSMFRERYELERNLEQLRWKLSRNLELTSLFSELVTGLESTRRITMAALYRLSTDGTAYRLTAHSAGPDLPPQLDAAGNRLFLERLAMDGVLQYEALIRAKQAVNLGWVQIRPEDHALDEVIHTMEDLHAGLCLAIRGEGRTLGLLAIDDDRMREAYSENEVEEFRRLADQVAVGIQNSRLYERMKERDRLAALGQMAAGLAHEIRNPLGAIKGAAQCLEDERMDSLQGVKSPFVDGNPKQMPAAFGEDASEFVDIIVEEVDRLNRVVSQFLDYARPLDSQKDPVDVNTVLRRTAQLMVPKSGRHAVELKLSDEKPTVRGDPGQLQQVFLNLGLNGIQAMDEPGVLTLSTDVRHNEWDQDMTPMVIISFSDTGRGIKPEQMKQLFVPFFTTRPGGTGLGLPICQKIAEAHGGRIEVNSTPGTGSTFTVVLPKG